MSIKNLIKKVIPNSILQRRDQRLREEMIASYRRLDRIELEGLVLKIGHGLDKGTNAQKTHYICY